MSDKEITKLAYAEAEKEARDRQVKEVKKIIVATLEKLDGIKKNIKKLQEEERILKLDLDDIKDGKLDRIAERQSVDPKAKEVSVVVIIKEVVTERYSPWQYPYQIVWQVPSYVPYYPSHTIMSTGSNNMLLNNCVNAVYTSANSGGCDSSLTGDIVGCSTITCSVAKDAAIGAYSVAGHTVNFR